MMQRVVSRRLPLLIVFFALPAMAAAQSPYLVRDLQGLEQAQSSAPFGFVPFAGEVVFTARTEALGFELWATDGSGEGTRLVADLCPGPCNGIPQILGATAGRLFFAARNAATGRELWSLPAGGVPEPLGDLCPGPCDGVGFAAGLLGEELYFQGTDGRSGMELWVSDGTAAGTRPLRDICAGECASTPTGFAALGEALYFAAGDGVHGRELWRTDGTTAGTALLADLCPGCDGNPQGLAAVDGHLYFGADDGEVGREPWRTDGTGAGTERVADLQQGFRNEGGEVVPNGSNPQRFLEMLGVLYAIGACEEPSLCAWKRTPGGWSVANELFPEGAARRPFDFVEKDGTLFFTTGLPALSSADRLWTTDGTVGGTRSAFTTPVTLWDVAPVEGGVLFGAVAEVFGELVSTLWFSDGEPGGATPLGLFTSGGSIEFPRGLTVTPAGILFQANFQEQDTEIFLSDGSVEGTRQLLDLAPATSSSNPELYFAMRDRILFRTAGRFGQSLWGSDGTAEETVGLMSRFETPVRLGSSAFFFSYQEQGLFLAVTDGTAFGTAETGTVHVPEDPRELVALRPDRGDPALLFGDQGIGQRLWKVDPFGGEGTLLLDHNPEWVNVPCPFSPCSDPLRLPGFFTPAREGTFFLASEPGTPIQLWYTDGGPALRLRTFGTGHVLVGEYLSPQREDLLPRDFIPFRGGVLFTAFEEESGFEPWFSDGTEAGTYPLGDLLPGAEGSGARAFDVASHDPGVAYFFARTGEADTLWRTDGTPQGTAAVTPLRDGLEAAVGVEIEAVGKRVYFTAATPSKGAELWVSDGTPAGTRPLKEILPGPRGSVPAELTAVPAAGRGVLLFAADDGVHGQELWLAAGRQVRRLADLAPGPAPSGPRNFIVTPSRVFFTADDGTHGRELWALPVGGLAGSGVLGPIRHP